MALTVILPKPSQYASFGTAETEIGARPGAVLCGPKTRGKKSQTQVRNQRDAGMSSRASLGGLS